MKNSELRKKKVNPLGEIRVVLVGRPLCQTFCSTGGSVEKVAGDMRA